MKPIRSVLILFSFLFSFAASAQKNWAINDTITAVGTNVRIDWRFDANGRPYTKRGGSGSQGNAKAVAYLADVVAAAGGGVQQVNGKAPSSGNVTLTTTDLGEGSNQYFTVGRARAAFSATGPLVYNSATGGFTFSGTPADVQLGNVNNTSDALKPISNATQSALNAKEPTIPTGSAAQYVRGDKTLATLDKGTVGLPNAENTSDANKPISTATQNALDTKAAIASTVFRVNVATYAALTSLTVPTGLSYIVKVANDESQVAPYTTNQYYFKDDSGLTFKILLDKQ